jgi:molybdate transport system substrate-binding protein
VGLASGLGISALIVGLYLLWGGRFVDTSMFVEELRRIGLGIPWRYAAGATYWVLVNSVLEEYVWRWFCVRQCERLWSKPLAIAASALFFTLHHVVAMSVYFPPAAVALCSLGVFMGGLIWSAMYLRYRSIWPGYLSHALVDVAVFGVGAWLLFGGPMAGSEEPRAPRGGAAEKDGAATLTVFAASSTTDCMSELAARYQDRTGSRVNLSFASSSVLARQVEQGAPCDVFLSADLEWMDYLAERGRIQAATRRNLLGNRLVLIRFTESGAVANAAADASNAVVDAENPLKILSGYAGRLAVGDPAHVPAGRYAEQALRQLGLWEVLQPALIPAENVRTALLLVERGEADLGIVYASDARASRSVRVVGAFAEETHQPIVYPAAVIAGAAPEAAQLLEFLDGAEAAQVWEKAGFSVK